MSKDTAIQITVAILIFVLGAIIAITEPEIRYKLGLEKKPASTATPVPVTPLVPPSNVSSTNLPIISDPTFTQLNSCDWDVMLILSNFAADSIIEIQSNYSEIVCSNQRQITSGWTVTHPTKTDANGKLIYHVTHHGVGHYTYIFTDETGNSGHITFDTD